MADRVKEGMALTASVSNYSAADMLRFAAELKDHGIPLATNQCQYSILRGHPEIHGLMQTCDDHSITFHSYSSLAMDQLSGKHG